jgi:hypothetical protein
MPIDAFLRSLAHDRGANAAAVILSGTGTDGTLGAEEIKAKGGLVLVQSEDSAGYDGMPRSAANSGVADIIVAPEEMPQRLSQYFSHAENTLKKQPAASDQRDWLNKIFAILRTGIFQGRTAIIKRGAADGQCRAAKQGGRAVGDPRRHTQFAQQHTDRHHFRGQPHADQTLNDGSDRHHQSDPDRHGASTTA